MLATKTVLVSLNITQWTGQKFDKNATSKANEVQHAKQDAGRFNKHLIHKDALRDIRTITNEARTFHYANTLAWNENTGTRILPVRMITKYTDFMRKKRQEFDIAKEKFIRHYPVYVDYARNRLGDMFNITDFPQQSELQHRFGFSTSISPVPSSGDFRIDIPRDALEQIQADMDTKLVAAEKAAVDDLRKRTRSVLDALFDTLSNPNKRVYESTVRGNVQQLVDQLHALNFSDDEGLEELRSLIDQQIGNLDPVAIREDDLVRQEALNKTDAIMRKMAGAGYGT